MVQIWNTIGCNACPEELWNGIWWQRTARYLGGMWLLGFCLTGSYAPRRLLFLGIFLIWLWQPTMFNGPRYWQMDSIVLDKPVEGSADSDGNRKLRSWNDIGMGLVATMPLGRDLLRQPYDTMDITRSTVWRFRPGRQVYQIVTDEDKVFTMQSYHGGDTDITDLLDLQTKLGGLPSDWQYRCRILGPRGLDVAAIDGVATILQDELDNTYMQVQEPETNSSCPLYEPEDCVQETDETYQEFCAGINFRQTDANTIRV